MDAQDFPAAALSVPARAHIASGWPSEPLPGQLAALVGPRGVLRLHPWLVAPALLAGENLLVADGGNSFNPYDLSTVAQWAGLAPKDLLRRVHVSRAFTCHQMLALVRDLTRFAQQTQSRLVLLPGLLDTFYDEAIPTREARRVWHATLDSLKRLTIEDLLLLTICHDHPMEPKRPLKPALLDAADRVVTYQPSREDQPQLRLLKPHTERFDLTVSASLAAVWNVGR